MATVGLLEKKLKGRESQAESIRCSRCMGLMIVEGAFDSIVGAGHADFLVRRCVQCGEVVDPVILQNRRSQNENDSSRTVK
jgi:hypothetical protein